MRVCYNDLENLFKEIVMLKKKILFIEPFYSGSHASWLNQLKERSSHDIKLLTLEGRFWKWRMYGAAYTLAEMCKNLDFTPEMIIASDMIDLSVFIALTRNIFSPDIPICLYFHENQFAYPWDQNSEDKNQGRDVNYGFMNYTSALSADHIFFNSEYNRDSFLIALKSLLKKMPDNKHVNTTELIKKKSTILPIGMDLASIDSGDASIYKHTLPLVLWNHRWEFDKNPHDFFKALISLKKEGYEFKLALMGEVYKNAPKVINESIEILKDNIVVQGYTSLSDYRSWLKASHIAPVTSNHDFFGISVMEAVYAGCHPILPNRLTYPALYRIEENSELFYETYDEFYSKLKSTIDSFSINNRIHNEYKYLAEPYDWNILITKYDELFSSIIK